jgi:transcriptional regulator with XRE-family HTH domain
MFAGERMSEQLEYVTSGTSASTPSISRQFFHGFADPEYRSVYVDEHLNTFLPFQIRTIREQRGWTQGQLGQYCGGKAQGWISKLEDPNYGKFTLATLKTIARAFDCMLEVRFKSYRDFSDEQERRRPGDLRVHSYEQDSTHEHENADSGVEQSQRSGKVATFFSPTGTATPRLRTTGTGKKLLVFPHASRSTLKQANLFVENVA